MSVSVTLSQIIYDLLARVLPGFFFLALLGGMVGSDLLAAIVPGEGSDSLTDSFGRGLVYVAACYLAGWLLRAPTYLWDREKKARDAHQGGPSDEDVDLQRIRLFHPEAGTRLLKRRAEARMLDGLMVGSALNVVLGLILVVAVATGRLDSERTLASVIWPLAIAATVAPLCLYLGMEAWKAYRGLIETLKLALERGPLPGEDRRAVGSPAAPGDDVRGGGA